ncbi:MAG TPA: choice-of-anchor Q domain-containing protein [Candidatus Sulfotelmatobacter sp.]|jgi:uncharacterized repeat protein (TIGR02543 family)|nr:choice-of-anchor Q domain-containing protein [Candidatus Sulfotelmatobacter sp.]
MRTKIIFGAWLLCFCLLRVETATATSYTLTLTAQGPGTVFKNPNNASYLAGVTVTITGTSNAGAYFTGWTGDTNSLVSPLNITMNNNYVITGNFSAFPTYPLTLTTNGQGSILLNPAGPNYTSNTLVTATATPSAGWVFAGWTGSAAGTTNPLSFNMNAANSLTGNFAQLPAINLQPVSVTNQPGSTVGFSANAGGTSPLAYQWYFNSVGVPGATNSSLSLTNVQFTSAGFYQLQVKNSYGSATSSVVVLVLTNGFANPVSVCDEPDLRAAIKAGGWIQFGCNGTITLTNTIVVSNNVILDGSLVSATVSGGNAVRMFTVSPNASLTISNLTLANGLVQSTNSNDGSFKDGGAIYNNAGTVVLVSCALLNNNVMNEYQSSSYPTPVSAARGGAIFNNGGTASLQGSVFTNNLAMGTNGNAFGNGGAIFTTNGSVTISGCSFIANGTVSCLSVPSGGGALYIASGNVRVAASLFSTNTASGIGANDVLTSGEAIPGFGGAIVMAGGNVTVQQCQFLNNLAYGAIGGADGFAGPSRGGAIYSMTTASISDSFFFNNQAPGRFSALVQTNQGGAIFNSGMMILNRCCVCSNSVSGSSGTSSELGISSAGAGQGGGLFNAGQLWMTNCTVALNSAVAGLGFYFYGMLGTNGIALGAGIYNASNATAFLMNSTLDSNACNAAEMPVYYQHPFPGFSAGDQVANQGGTLSLENTLLAYAGTNGNAYGTVTDDGYNFSSDGSAALFASGSSYNYTDPMLLALTNNGGSTLTMALAPDSPAIDYGDNNGAPDVDQRGFIRPFGSSVDAGAYEYGSTNFAALPMGLGIAGSGQNCTVSFTAMPSYTYHLQWSTNLTSWNDLEVIGGLSASSNVTSSVNLQGSSRKFYRVWYQ